MKGTVSSRCTGLTGCSEFCTVFVALNFDIKASSASADDKPLFEAIELWKKRGLEKVPPALT